MNKKMCSIAFYMLIIGTFWAEISWPQSIISPEYIKLSVVKAEVYTDEVHFKVPSGSRPIMVTMKGEFEVEGAAIPVISGKDFGAKYNRNRFPFPDNWGIARRWRAVSKSSKKESVLSSGFCWGDCTQYSYDWLMTGKMEITVDVIFILPSSVSKFVVSSGYSGNTHIGEAIIIE